MEKQFRRFKKIISRLNRQNTTYYIKNTTWNSQKSPPCLCNNDDIFKNGKKTANLDILEA